MAQKDGTVRAEIAGHGQFETKAEWLDELIDSFWSRSVDELAQEVKEHLGDPNHPIYNTNGLSKIELMLIIAELNGLATN